MSESTTRLVTYKDCIDHAIDYLGATVTGDASRDAKRAVQNAYRSLASLHNWSYYYTRGRLVTNEAYSTGTIEYDHCLTPEHEALTREGWKRLPDLILGEEILSYDHKAGTTKWLPVQKVHSFYLNGEIYEVVRKKRAVLRCTDNHRHPIYKRMGNGGVRSLQNAGFVRTTELTNEHCVPISAPHEFSGESILSPRLAAILGWAITDGHGLLDGDKDYGSRISQSPTANAVNCAAIGLLTETDQRGPYEYGGAASWCIPASVAKQIRSVIKKTSDLPRVVSRLSPDAARAMYDAMLSAEGSCTAAGRLRFSQWNEEHRPIAEAFQIVSILSGRAANIVEGEYQGKTKFDVTVRTSRNIKPTRDIRRTPYSGQVFCPQVETGAWVVRCNGAMMITGNSGGATERRLTLTGGTFPSWAYLGDLVINGVVYEIAAIVNSTVITLALNSNPGEDIAAGETYTLYRDTYPLPIDFQATDDFLIANNSNILTYVSPGQWLQDGQGNPGPGTPSLYTFRSDPNYYGTMAISFSPPCDGVESYDYMYKRRPRPMLVSEYNIGTASVTGSSATVTGVGTVWRDNHIGSVIRFSEDAGVLPTGITGDNPFEIQRVIVSVESETSLTVDRVVPQAFTNAKYTLSDPADIEDGAMLTALFREIEKQLRISRRMKAAPDEESHYMKAMAFAREADSRTFSSRSMG